MPKVRADSLRMGTAVGREIGKGERCLEKTWGRFCGGCALYLLPLSTYEAFVKNSVISQTFFMGRFVFIFKVPPMLR